MSKRYDIASIEDLVAFLGGDTEVAKWLGLSQPAVAMWKQRRHIAGTWHMRLAAAVRRKGKTLDPRVFGLSEDEISGLLPPSATVACRSSPTPN